MEFVIVNDERPFVCDFGLCNKTFTTQEALNAHTTSHKQVARYNCIDCKYATDNLTRMNTHTRIHTKQKPYACPIANCKFRTTAQDNLRKHLRRPHDANGRLKSASLRQ